MDALLNMSTDFIILSKQKPAEGARCNGCGYCCQAEACSLSLEYLHSEEAPCIALEFDGEQYRCGLVMHASKYLKTPAFGDELIRGLLTRALGVGYGCDCGDPGIS